MFIFADSKGNPHHLCMLTYYIPPGFKPYALPHGNSKSCKPFHPTWPSTLELVKKEGSCTGPKEVVARVSERVGGVMGASAPGQLPRGEMQVSNAKRHLQFKAGYDGTAGCDGSDELFIMMQKAKTEDPFIRDIKTTPDPAIVACTDQQLDDLVRFCAPPTGVNCSILTVDPTFCLGDFECIPQSHIATCFWSLDGMEPHLYSLVQFLYITGKILLPSFSLPPHWSA
jgi:hypothetical protein